MSLSRRRPAEPAPAVEINIVPLVDVALVLLIIFMVTATFVTNGGFRFTLPASSATLAGDAPTHELVIGVARNGQLYWNGLPVDDARLAAALQDEAARHGATSRVTIQGDTHAEHGRVVAALTVAQEAGFTQLVVATQPESGGRHATP